MPGAAEDILDISLARKGILLRVSSEIKAVSKAADDPEIKGIAQSLRDKKRELANNTIAGPAKNENAGNTQSQMERIKQEIEILEAELGRKIQRVNRARMSVSAQRIRQLLKKDQALIDFLVFQEYDVDSLEFKGQKLIAIVVDPERQSGIRLIQLGGFDSISKQISKFREAISEPEYNDIKDIDISYGDYFENTILTIKREDDSEFKLFVGTEERGDRKFTEQVLRLWKAQRKNSGEKTES